MSGLAKPVWSGATAAAQALLTQQRLRTKFSGLPPPLAPTELMQAYATQDAWVDLCARQRHTHVSGYKIAITTPVMREFVGFDDAISGCVLADTVHASGHAVSAQAFQHLIIEFELALQFADDLPMGHTEWTAQSILAHVECAYPCLEIADDRHAVYTELKQHFLALVAENAWNHGVVLGGRIEKADFEQLWQTTGTASVNGQCLGQGHSRDVMGHPLQALAWIANHMTHRGRSFKSGEWVTTGSWLASYFPSPGQTLRFELTEGAQVCVHIQ